MMSFIKKNWQNIFWGGLLLLLFIPQTGFPVKVYLNRVLSFSPSEVNEEDRSILSSYRWRLSDLETNEFSFENARGKVVVVNSWATWCPPCVAEMPSLQRLHDLYKDRVNFYFVSNEAPEKLTRFMEKKEYNFPVYISKGAPPKELSNNSLPTTYVISKGGSIVVEKTGAADWDSESTKKLIDKLLAE